MTTNLNQHSCTHRCLRSRNDLIFTFLKKQFMKTCTMLVVISMICSMTRIPVALAYFTSGEPKTSDAISLVIKKPDGESMANVVFTDSFIEEEGVPKLMAMAFKAQSPEVMSTVFSQPPPPPQTIEALVSMEEDFNVGDLYVPSIEIHYEDKSAFALSGELSDEGNLVVEFSRPEIASWFEGAAVKPDQVTFDVTGEGYAEGIYRFLFTGQATIKLEGKYQVNKIAMLGSDAFLVPPAGGSVDVAYQLINQDMELLEEDITWGLLNPHQGVEINERTGELTAQGYAPEGSLTVTAEIVSERRTHSIEKNVTICQDPGLSIMGVETISIPQTGHEVPTLYQLVTESGATLDSVTWELAGDTTGVVVDQSGNVYVDGTATAESITLVARAALLGIPLAAETTVTLSMPEPTQSEAIPLDLVQRPADPVLITGNNFIFIPGAGGAGQYTYTATDREGNPLKGVDWSIQGELNGLTLADSNLIVSDFAAEGTIVLQATFKQVGDQEGEVNLLTGSKLITLAFPAPSEVKLTGPGTLTIPAPGENDKPLNVETEVLDQKGNKLEGEAVTWELAGVVQGVFISAAGELTVTSLATPGTITLIARSVTNNNLVGTITVDLVADSVQKPGGGGGEELKDVNKDDEDNGNVKDPGDVREPEADDEVIEDDTDSQDDDDEKHEDPVNGADPDQDESGQDDEADQGDQNGNGSEGEDTAAGGEMNPDPVERRDNDDEPGPGDDPGDNTDRDDSPDPGPGDDPGDNTGNSDSGGDTGGGSTDGDSSESSDNE